MSRERLQKILARAGVASRRAAEALITDGRVRVNGRIVTELGTQADGRRDRVEVDGRRVVFEHAAYYLLHKPRGVVSTLRDPEGRPSLGELLSRLPERLFPIGRLDFHTSGALLVTNDGELADALLHPSREVPKVYVAKLRGDVDAEALEALRNGVELDDGHMTAPADVIVLREESGSTWVRITIHEGRNRQIVRMGDAVGHPVSRLARISFAGIDTEGLRPGQMRPLDEKEVEKLKTTYLLPARARRLNEKRRAAHAARRAAEQEAGEGVEDEALAAGGEDAGLDGFDGLDAAEEVVPRAVRRGAASDPGAKRPARRAPEVNRGEPRAPDATPSVAGPLRRKPRVAGRDAAPLVSPPRLSRDGGSATSRRAPRGAGPDAPRGAGPRRGAPRAGGKKR